MLGLLWTYKWMNAYMELQINESLYGITNEWMLKWNYKLMKASASMSLLMNDC